MMIVWGSKMMGKVDVVPGLFHVATKFGHLYYLPLIPTESYVVLAENGRSFRGVPISLSGKSILIAWLRAGLFLGALITSILIVVIATEPRGPSVQTLALPVTIAAVLWTGFGFTWHSMLTRASYERACEIAGQIGLQQAGLDAIAAVYGRAPARGFEVQSVAGKDLTAPGAAMPAPPLQPTMRAPQPVADSGPIPLEPAPQAAPDPSKAQPGEFGLT